MMIAIDGPAGSGKSTIAKRIAALKELTYIDTGAMYRAVTFHMMEQGIPAEDPRIGEALQTIRLDFSNGRILLNGKDVSEEIRTPEVTRSVSDYSKIPAIRRQMQTYQRQIALKHPVVMDGRDIGTVVLPDADLKIFLVASVEERAKRRLRDFESKGFRTTLQDQIDDIQRRDEIDSSREMSPLKQAVDAHLIDTSLMSIEEVVETILNLIDEVSHVSLS